MAEAGLWEIWDVPADELATLHERLPSDRPVLMDSIWLEPEYVPFFLADRRERRIGAMLHSFPSMIEATEAGRAPLAQPSVFEREALEQLDVVVVPGLHYADALSERRVKLVVAEPGIEDSWRAEPRRRSGPCRLVSVGAVTPRKGFLDVFDAFAASSSPEVTWSIIGSLDVDPAYANLVAKRASAMPWVTLHGQMSPDAARRLVQRADVLLMPSYDENQPLVLWEAMAASVPAVAYAAGATHRMMENESTGVVVPIGDRAALAAQLRRLVDDEALRYRMAMSCWQRQRSLLNWRQAAERAKRDLARVLGQPPP